MLENAQLVNSVRGINGYTGTYKGKPVSIMGSGMGMPSIGIYSYELFKFYDVDNIIRIGSAGSYVARLGVHDVVLCSKSYSDSSYALYQAGEKRTTLFPSPELNEAIEKTAQELGIELKKGVVYSRDVFYSEPEVGTWDEVRRHSGTECVEMESFALFHNANVLGKRAATLLTISDSFVTNVVLDAEERQKSFNNMMSLAMETAISL